MQVKDRIQQFIQTHPHPLQPSVTLEYNNQFHTIGNDNRLINRNRSKLSLGYDIPITANCFCYDPKTKLMEVATIELSRKVKDIEYRKWEYNKRYFIPKEEKVLYCINGDKVPEAKNLLRRIARMNG